MRLAVPMLAAVATYAALRCMEPVHPVAPASRSARLVGHKSLLGVGRDAMTALLRAPSPALLQFVEGAIRRKLMAHYHGVKPLDVIERMVSENVQKVGTWDEPRLAQQVLAELPETEFVRC